jgi:Sec-independent protein secretion pathway component TatC
MEASGNRVDVGRVLTEAFQEYSRFAVPLLGGALVMLGIAGAIRGVLEASGGLALALIGLIIYIAAGVLYTGYVVKLVQDTRDGQMHHTAEKLFESAAPYIGTLILNGVLAAIAIAIGFALLIVPGLILITIWAVVAPAIVVERRGAIEAFGRSRELVRGHGWPVFGAIVLAYLTVLIVSFVSAGIGDAIAGDAGHVILGTIGDVVAAPILALVASMLFFDLGGGEPAQ